MTERMQATSQALLTHPRFCTAFDHYVNHLVEWRKSLGVINKVLSNVGISIVYYIVFLHATAKADSFESGATFSSVFDICRRRGQCGTRYLRTVIGILRFTGQIKAVRSRMDQRLLIYVPSPKLLHTLRHHLAKTFACIDLVIGGDGCQRRIIEDERFLGHLMETSGRQVIDRQIMLVEPLRALNEVLDLRGGLPTVAAIVQARLANQSTPSPREIAHMFSISASQVRLVLIAAEKCGLIGRFPDGAPDVRPLIEELKTLLANELGLYCAYTFGLDNDPRLFATPPASVDCGA